MARTRGFTLVELLIALAVMAMLAVLSWQGLDGMTRAQAQTQAYTDEVLTLQTGLAQWTSDLDAMLPVKAGTEDLAIDWDGRALRLVRTSTDSGPPGPRVVAWTRRDGADGGQWLRWQSPVLHGRIELLQAWQRAAQWAQNPGTEERRHEVAIVPLQDWRIFYYRGNAWTNPLSSADAAPAQGTAQATDLSLPDGVRLVLELPAGRALAGTLVRDWVNSKVGGNKS